MGQGRSKKHLDSIAETVAYSMALLFVAVLIVFVYYLLAHWGVAPKPPPVDLVAWIKNAAK